jgi:hypothetical protein
MWGHVFGALATLTAPPPGILAIHIIVRNIPLYARTRAKKKGTVLIIGYIADVFRMICVHAQIESGNDYSSTD